MGLILLVGRLAWRGLRRRRVETVLLLLAMMAATTTLTLGLVLRDAARDPYQHTRQATNGPDVVAVVSAYASERPDDPADMVIDRPADLSGLEALGGAAGVVDHSGPFPVVAAELRASGGTSDVQAVGRDVAPASVDQPAVTSGGWVQDGGVVIEAAFAEALDVTVGDAITLDGRSFEVVGTAVTAGVPPYPKSTCFVPTGCVSGATPEELAELPPDLLRDPGQVWLTIGDVQGLAGRAGVQSYVVNLALAEPADAEAFVEAHQPTGPGAPRLESWEAVLEETTELAGDAQTVLRIGSWLLGLLAVATVSVLVGGRMTEQAKRVGLLKAVGGTPRLLAAVLLAEYVVVALVAAVAGLVVGSVAAPLLTKPGAGLLGRAGTPSVTPSTVVAVVGVALAVAT
ncbi:MAG: FtsX-like permease family protein, partial [Ilumatobacteraceae bacterium]